MNLITSFLGKDGQIFGRDERIFSEIGINNITDDNKQKIREYIEGFLDSKGEIEILKADNEKIIVSTIDIKKVIVKENYLGGEKLEINVKWS
ncbi:hypothetical protein [Mammaliicoccus sciuri]|uniref:hypothetical protein n=1 Tax=Mammaliicoccus sciuri TaxID=1296 RepID=UPI002DBB13DE|nr:hypothetical protein [Mammaliicoccus sciuri]MEB7049772.1 hypothetical protein [Mammaliicoccus sciuri]